MTKTPLFGDNSFGTFKNLLILDNVINMTIFKIISFFSSFSQEYCKYVYGDCKFFVTVYMFWWKKKWPSANQMTDKNE